MDVLALTLARHPATPGPTLLTLLDFPGTTRCDDLLPEAVATHPNLPVELASRPQLIAAASTPTAIHDAMTRPGTTSTTRARFLDQLPPAALLTYLRTTPHAHPDPVARVVAAGAPSNVTDQVCVALHPAVPRTARVRALDGLLTGSAVLGAGQREMLVTEACRHPQQLARWAAAAPKDIAGTLAAYAARRDPLGDRLADLEDQLGARKPVALWVAAVKASGDAAIAEHALALAGGIPPDSTGLRSLAPDDVAGAIVDTPRLFDTPVWARAHQLLSTMGSVLTAPDGQHTPLLLQELLDRNEVRALASFQLPYDADETWFAPIVRHGDRAVRGYERFAPAMLDTTELLLRVALHPRCATPTRHDAVRAATSLLDRPEVTQLRSVRGPRLRVMVTLANCVACGGLATAGADVPVAALGGRLRGPVASSLELAAANVAVHAIPTSLLGDPAATRALLRLAGLPDQLFPGTVGQLVDTTLSIHG